MVKISPQWVTGTEQGKSSGRIATFGLCTGMFRDDISSIPGETFIPLRLVISSFVRTGYTTRRWGWLLGRIGYSITHHCPLYPSQWRISVSQVIFVEMYYVLCHFCMRRFQIGCLEEKNCSRYCGKFDIVYGYIACGRIACLNYDNERLRRKLRPVGCVSILAKCVPRCLRGWPGGWMGSRWRHGTFLRDLRE